MLYLIKAVIAQVLVHCKKRLTIFPSQAGMSLTKASLAGNNLVIPELVSDIPAGDRKIANLFYSVACSLLSDSYMYPQYPVFLGAEANTQRIKRKQARFYLSYIV